jgi:hypothetical protein
MVISSENASRKASSRWLFKMRTISLGISFAMTSVFAVFLPNAANACSFSLQYGGKMARNVTDISNVDRWKLADLLITVRASVANQGPVVIYGLADTREDDASSAARKR